MVYQLRGALTKQAVRGALRRLLVEDKLEDEDRHAIEAVVVHWDRDFPVGDLTCSVGEYFCREFHTQLLARGLIRPGERRIDWYKLLRDAVWLAVQIAKIVLMVLLLCLSTTTQTGET